MPALNDDRAVTQYLARYAEPEADSAAQLPMDSSYPHALVIPACREAWDSMKQGIDGIAAPFLLILIANAPDNDTDAQAETTTFISSIKSEAVSRIIEHEHCCLFETGYPFDVLLVDRAQAAHAIPRRQGVGLARKIGADIALRLMADGRMASGLIYTTDADTTLPPNYFNSSNLEAGVAAVNFPFVHRAIPGLKAATHLYEISMLYYVAGLRSAGSRYAHTTIGSTMAVNPIHYARVRGFPKRNAAEDFYLLNKLAKIGEVKQLAAPSIEVAARDSDRVPFGTGPALRTIAQLDDPLSEYTFFDPQIFSFLGRLLAKLESADPNLTDLPLAVRQWSEDSGLAERLQRDPGERIHDWMDGLRTLKLIHFLRDNGLPSQPLEHIVGTNLIPDFPATSDRLEDIRNHLAQRCFHARVV